MRRHATSSIGSVAMAVLFVAACGNTLPNGEEDVSAITQRLSEDNGGYALTNENEQPPAEDIELPANFDYDRDRVPNAQGLLDSVPDVENGVIEGDDVDPSATDPSTAERPERPADCPRLLMKGHWKPLAKSIGVFRGAVVNPDGEVVGFMKGVYGLGRFFGKAVQKDGRAMALLAGVYGGGLFKGRFRSNVGLRGVVHGQIGKGVYRGVMNVFCRNQCEEQCDGGWAPSAEGGCHCLPSCPDGTRLNLCPARVRTCVRVPRRPMDANATGSEPSAEGTDPSTDTDAASTNTDATTGEPDYVVICRVQCARPRCTPIIARPQAAGERPVEDSTTDAER